MKQEKQLRSRILEHFSKELLLKIEELSKDVRISDNNTKTDILVGILDHYLKDKYVELGPGTNRYAILIDNYVFKIALDKWGIRDNINEFNMSQELQPYVVKTYETNRIISVCEYVTVISKDEFIEKKYDIQKVLSILADSYLLGDVGTVSKNYLNWGYRDNGELVILDYAYIYNIKGDEILCSSCQSEILEYDENFHELICPRCQRKYSFIDIRRKIPSELEKKEAEIGLSNSYKLTKSIMIIKNNNQEPKQEINHEVKQEEKEENTMSNHNHMDSYLKMLQLLSMSGDGHDDEKEAEGIKYIPAEGNKTENTDTIEEPKEIMPEESEDIEQIICNTNEVIEEEIDIEDDDDEEYEDFTEEAAIIDEIFEESDDDECEDEEDDPEYKEVDEDENEDKVIQVHNQQLEEKIKVIEVDEGVNEDVQPNNLTSDDKVATEKINVDSLREELKGFIEEDEDEIPDDDFEKFYDEIDKIKFNNKGGKKSEWD